MNINTWEVKCVIRGKESREVPVWFLESEIYNRAVVRNWQNNREKVQIQNKHFAVIC